MDFAERYGPWAVIAGASEGVGATVTRQLGDRGINVVLVSRRQELLDEVAATVVGDTRTVALDLSRPDAAAVLADATADLEVGLLVYNTGAMPPKAFLDHPVNVWQGVVARNCVTVLGATYHYAGAMTARGHGGIVLVSSKAAWAGTSHLAVYGGTKAFDLVFAEGLWAELHPAGVDVLSMVLGATDTPEFRKVLANRKPDGREIPGRIEMASSDDVAREMLDSLGDGPTIPTGAAAFGVLPRREAVEQRSRSIQPLLS